MPEITRHDDGSVSERPVTVLFHFLGCVAYDTCAALQRRLVELAQCESRPRMTVLLAEHPPEITVGRRGSHRHVRLSADELAARRLHVRWVSRGGGCVLHSPGQLAIYPIAPLGALGWTLAQFRRRLNQGLTATLRAFGFEAEPTLPGAGIWGRSGALAVSGIGESHGVTHHGAWLNVHPELSDFSAIDVVPPDAVAPRVRTTMSSLLAEHRRPVRMTAIRASIVEQLSAALDCDAPHLFTGHALL